MSGLAPVAAFAERSDVLVAEERDEHKRDARNVETGFSLSTGVFDNFQMTIPTNTAASA